ncbi:MAG: FtsH protease activity modulator HflK [Xanthomonadales bacterium]|nr:FtsH protease activity modulator HflK [Xanthomonadales bacterium]ODU94652.1 MAG: HflK protein [Rhodanobacter sp. SCN 66-43]OJY85233.1 MAG: HflK protein [Xanthomonadales bacterium 66-474]
MPWKEPGEKPREPKGQEPRGQEPRGREPWGQGGHGSGPDLEAWFRKMRRGLGPFGRGPLGVLALIAVLVVLWLVASGWTLVGDQQAGVLLRFGKLESVLQPGLHLHFPVPIDRVQIVDLGRTRTLNDEARLLTSDGQLAMVDYYVQYKVSDARKFLFATRDAEESVRNAATVAMRAVVGTHPLHELMERSDDAFGKDAHARLARALANVDLGVTVTGMGIQNVGVPSEVKPAFDGIAKAREDAKAAQATAHADVARGKVEAAAQAAAMKAGADSYRAKAVAEAQAEVARFDQILAQYQASPQVTRHRLWLDAMRDVLSRNRAVVNTGSGSVIVQFPVRRPETPSEASPESSGSAPASAASVPAPAASSPVPVTSGPALQGIGT